MDIHEIVLGVYLVSGQGPEGPLVNSVMNILISKIGG
jgi:hypothetical protein